MPRKSKLELRLAVMKHRLAVIRKALKQEKASLVQARKELGLSKKKALPKGREYLMPRRSKTRAERSGNTPSY